MAAASGSRAKWAWVHSFISPFPFPIGVLLSALRGSPARARLWRKSLPTLSPAVLSIFTLLLTNCNHFQATILLTSGSVISALRSEKGTHGRNCRTHGSGALRHARELSRFHGAHRRRRHEPRSRRHRQPGKSQHFGSPRRSVSPRAAHQRNGNCHR